MQHWYLLIIFRPSCRCWFSIPIPINGYSKCLRSVLIYMNKNQSSFDLKNPKIPRSASRGSVKSIAAIQQGSVKSIAAVIILVCWCKKKIVQVSSNIYNTHVRKCSSLMDLMQPISSDFWIHLANQNGKSYTRFYCCSFFRICMVLDDKTRIKCWSILDRIYIKLSRLM